MIEKKGPGEIESYDLDDILREYGGGAAPETGGEDPAPAQESGAPEPARKPEPKRVAPAPGPEEERADQIAADITASVTKAVEDVPQAPDPTPRREKPASAFGYGFILLVAAMALALALVAAAVFPDLEDPAWSIFVIGGLAVACIPMVIGSAKCLRDRGGVPTPAVMLAATVIYGCCGNLVEAVVAAVIYNIFQSAFDSVKNRETGFIKRRLLSLRTDGEGPVGERLDVTLRELDSGRVRPVVELSRFEWLALLGALGVALVIALIPPLFDGFNFLKWLERGMVILSVCVYCGQAGALMTYLNGAEAAIANGIWFADAGTLSACAEISSVLFNKTGTVTEGNCKVIHVDPVRISEEQLLYLAVQAGAYSDHPLDRALREYAGLTPERDRIFHHTVQPGFGSLVQMDGGIIVAVGNIDFMEKLGVRGDMYIPGETCVFVSVGKTCVGRIDFADTIRSDAVTLVHDLKSVGVPNVALMTGDNALSATNICRRLGITEVYSDCRPQDKAARLQYIQETQLKGERAVFVSEAGHDRELLETANLSVTLGVGPEATGTFPDVLIATGELSKLSRMVRIAKEVKRKITATFLIAAAVRVLIALIAVFGAVPLWVSALLISLLQAASFFNTGISMD